MSLYDFNLGEVVEFCNSDTDGRWEVASIIKLDPEDSSLPFKVKWETNTYWIPLSNIRKVNGSTNRRRLQFRSGFTWYDLDLSPEEDLTFSANIGGQFVEFRYRPERTPEEILEKIRAERSENGELADWKLRELLNGDF